MTPTLAMIVEREAEIKGFKPENFYTVQMLVSGVAVTSKRFKTKHEADELVEKINAADKAKISKMETTTKTEKPPLLYDLPLSRLSAIPRVYMRRSLLLIQERTADI